MFSCYLLAFKTKLLYSLVNVMKHMSRSLFSQMKLCFLHLLVMTISDFVMKYDLDVFHGCDRERHTRVSRHLFHIDVRNELNDTVLSCCGFHLVFDVPVLFLWLFIMDED